MPMPWRCMRSAASGMVPEPLDLGGFGLVLLGEREELSSSMWDLGAAGQVTCPLGQVAERFHFELNRIHLRRPSHSAFRCSP